MPAESSVNIRIKATNETGPAFEGAKAGAESFKGAMQGLGLGAALGIAAATAAVVEFGKASIEAYAEVDKVKFAIKESFGDSADFVISQSEKMAEGTVLQGDVMMSAFVQISAKFKMLGLSVQEQAQFIQAAMDIAASRGATSASEFSAVLDQLSSGITGRAKGLRELGIAVDDNSSSMQRLNAIMEKGNSVMGAAGDYAETTAGKIDMLSKNMKDLEEGFGKGITSFMEIGKGAKEAGFDFQYFGEVLGRVGAILVTAFLTPLKLIASEIAIFINVFRTLKGEMSFGDLIESFKGMAENIIEPWKKVLGPIGEAKDKVEETSESMQVLGESGLQAGEDMSNAMKDTGEAVEELTGLVEALSDALDTASKKFGIMGKMDLPGESKAKDAIKQAKRDLEDTEALIAKSEEKGGKPDSGLKEQADNQRATLKSLEAEYKVTYGRVKEDIKGAEDQIKLLNDELKAGVITQSQYDKETKKVYDSLQKLKVPDDLKNGIENAAKAMAVLPEVIDKVKGSMKTLADAQKDMAKDMEEFNKAKTAESAQAAQSKFQEAQSRAKAAVAEIKATLDTIPQEVIMSMKLEDQEAIAKAKSLVNEIPKEMKSSVVLDTKGAMAELKALQKQFEEIKSAKQAATAMESQGKMLQQIDPSGMMGMKGIGKAMESAGAEAKNSMAKQMDDLQKVMNEKANAMAAAQTKAWDAGKKGADEYKSKAEAAVKATDFTKITSEGGKAFEPAKKGADEFKQKAEAATKAVDFKKIETEGTNAWKAPVKGAEEFQKKGESASKAVGNAFGQMSSKMKADMSGTQATISAQFSMIQARGQSSTQALAQAWSSGMQQMTASTNTFAASAISSFNQVQAAGTSAINTLASNWEAGMSRMVAATAKAVAQIIAELNKIPREIITIHRIITVNEGGGGGGGSSKSSGKKSQIGGIVTHPGLVELEPGETVVPAEAKMQQPYRAGMAAFAGEGGGGGSRGGGATPVLNFNVSLPAGGFKSSQEAKDWAYWFAQEVKRRMART